MAPRPYLSTAAALVGAAVIVAGTPAIMPHGDLQVTAQAPTPTKVSNAKYELTALSDISLTGLVDAYFNGWGGYIGSGFDPDTIYPPDEDGNPPYVSDPYYPGINGAVAVYDSETGDLIGYRYDQNPVFVTGAPGAAYYVISNALDDGGLLGETGIYHYYYEVGAAGGNAIGAVLYVGASEIFGADSVAAQLAKTVFVDGILPNVQATVIGLATLVPEFNVGPVTVGGGNLASLYFTGSNIDGSYNYGATGLSAIAGYIAYSFANPPTTTTTTAAVTAKAAPAETVAADTTAVETKTEAAVADTTDTPAVKSTSTKVAEPEVEAAAVEADTTTATPVKTTVKANPLSDLAKSFDNILGGGKSTKADAAAEGAKASSSDAGSGTKSTGKKGTKSSTAKASSSDKGSGSE